MALVASALPIPAYFWMERYYAADAAEVACELELDGLNTHADSDELTIDETEMAEINFYTREEVEAALAGNGPFRCPPRHAIAHHLMQWWVKR